jgi:hypothetical protein
MLRWAAVVHVLQESREETRLSKSCFIFMFMGPRVISMFMGPRVRPAPLDQQYSSRCFPHDVCAAALGVLNMCITEAPGNSWVWCGMLDRIAVQDSRYPVQIPDLQKDPIDLKAPR